jgi:D-glycero-alpha-D-manno-heptose-7-phosphate kinase
MQIRCKAPLRLGLAGGGTDVSPYSDKYGGAVLNATLDMFAYCFIEETDDEKIYFESRDYGLSALYPLTAELPLDGRLDLFKFIYNRLFRKFQPKLRGFHMVTTSDAPYGSGLGGSSTLVVAVIRCFAEWWRLPLGEYEIAQEAYEVERFDAKLKGGKQDQYAATFGGVNFMEFYGDRVIVNQLRIKDAILNELQASLLLCYTGRSRESANIIEAQISNVVTGDEKSIEAMHHVKQHAFEMKESILTGNMKYFAEILDRSWQNKKQMAGSVTNNEIDHLYEFAKANGAKAGKVSGAGGGGFMMFFADPLQKFDLKVSLEKQGYRVSDIVFTSQGVQSWIV